jgi:MEDS: MEthanogen/methylotroph, DcmR Sensory domain
LKHFYAGKPTIYIHSASTREEIMDRVRDEGLDPHELNRRGLLTLIAAQDAYLKNPTFTPEFMVAFMRLQIIRKRADNHPSHLLCGEMDWFFTNAPGVESMHDYETALNDLLVEHPQTMIVCQYDLSRFAGIDVMKACCSHPGVVYRKRLYGLLRLHRRLGTAVFPAGSSGSLNPPVRGNCRLEAARSGKPQPIGLPM